MISMRELHYANSDKKGTFYVKEQRMSQSGDPSLQALFNLVQNYKVCLNTGLVYP